MPAAFGTSGLRGLVADLSDDVVGAYVHAFLAACDAGPTVYLGHDLRASSPGIARAASAAVAAAGRVVVGCGALPTPALALAAQAAGAGAIMVTGSHIPADRNGVKFYSRQGEITKAEEAAILASLGAPRPTVRAAGPDVRADARTDLGAGDRYVARYLDAFGPDALRGLRLGVWEHSAVGRDLLGALLRGLGAVVVAVDRLGVDGLELVRAVDAGTRARLRGWVAEHGLDALASTDGDSDRPLLADATGRLVPGDVLGQVVAAALGADVVVTPVSSNGGAEAGGRFARVVRTRIGSPFVIAAMEGVAADDPGARVVGYEANGGFLLAFDAAGPAGPLPALRTRDAFLPLVAALAAARGPGLAALVAAEPARFTAADRLQDVEVERATGLVAALDRDPGERAAFLDGLPLDGEPLIDRTDGLRMRFGPRTLHVRPSGNAPELRLYVEAESPQAAEDLLTRGLGRLRRALAAS